MEPSADSRVSMHEGLLKTSLDMSVEVFENLLSQSPVQPATKWRPLIFVLQPGG
jgi:hypothetical protein